MTITVGKPSHNHLEERVCRILDIKSRKNKNIGIMPVSEKKEKEPCPLLVAENMSV